MNNIRFFLPSLMILAALLTPLVAACGGGDEPEPEPTRDIQPLAINTPTPAPVVTNEGQAVQKLWVYLTICISIDTKDLQANVAGEGEWIVMPTEKSPQEFGTWRVNSEGIINSHNNRAKLWNTYIESSCDPSIMKPAATDVLNESDAVTAVWTQLAKCNPELPTNVFIAQKNRKTGSWVVVTSTKSQDDYGVWSVARDANIKPLNDRAGEVMEALNLVETDESSNVNADLAAQCSPVIRTDEEARNRVWSHLSSCYPKLDKKQYIETTWDPGNHLWVAVTILKGSDDKSSDTAAPVWNVARNGKITPANDSAVVTNKRVLMDIC